MKSLTKLFRFGPGPSSSHTIAPSIAARSFKKLVAPLRPDKIRVTLFGSLALTGVGHRTDQAVIASLAPCPVEVFFDSKTPVSHPLTLSFEAFKNGESILNKHYASLGGGEVTSDDDLSVVEKDIYPFRNLEEIKQKMSAECLPSLKEFCLLYEDPTIDDYLSDSLKRMFACLEAGLRETGYIPTNDNPRLHWKRCAAGIFETAGNIYDIDAKRAILITSYAYAVSESSACGEEVVTAPTCGSSGVLPAILYYCYANLNIPFCKIKDALYTAGLFGNLVKQNASIAGAIGGCQAEIGTASSMAAAALSELQGGSLYQIEYAAECAMEHFLGLSCDPVDGYVIIPCIERNGMGALRAYDSFLYAKYISPMRKNQVSFDDVVEAMKLTGDSLVSAYKETAEGGLAEILKKKTLCK
jgi:L-serine dehydratase